MRQKYTTIKDRPKLHIHAWIQRVLSEGVQLYFFFLFFLVDEGKEWIQIPLKVDDHQPTSETVFKWRFAGGPEWPNIEGAGLVALWYPSGSMHDIRINFKFKNLLNKSKCCFCFVHKYGYLLRLSTVRSCLCSQ